LSTNLVDSVLGKVGVCVLEWGNLVYWLGKGNFVRGELNFEGASLEICKKRKRGGTANSKPNNTDSSLGTKGKAKQRRRTLRLFDWETTHSALRMENRRSLPCKGGS